MDQNTERCEENHLERDTKAFQTVQFMKNKEPASIYLFTDTRMIFFMKCVTTFIMNTWTGQFFTLTKTTFILK